MRRKSPNQRTSTDSARSRHCHIHAAPISSASSSDASTPATPGNLKQKQKQQKQPSFIHTQKRLAKAVNCKSKSKSKSNPPANKSNSKNNSQSKSKSKPSKSKSKRQKQKMSPATPNGVVEQTVSLLGSAASYMRLPALASTGVAAVLTSLLYFKQKALIYPAHMPANARHDIPRPSQFGLHDFEDLVIPTEDGEKLNAFYIRAPRGYGEDVTTEKTGATSRNARTTVIMFHGNAGNIGHRLPIARMLRHMVRCNIFMVEYRGYGSSTGEPGESGLMVDAQTALDYLRNRAETSTHKFIVYGQSLGGAVAIRLVADNQQRGDVVGLVLENTFLSMRKLIPCILPPARYLTLLCHQVWPSDAVIPSITKVPILFLSGLKDEMVPPSHMRQLYDLSAAPNKIWKPLPLGDHNASVLEEGYFEAIADFVASATDEGPPEKLS